VALAQAVLKGDKMDDVVRDAVMMGVAAIHPLVTGRSEVSLATLARGRRRERWARVAVSAAKQCGRAVVPSIAEPRQFNGSVTDLPGPLFILVEPTTSAGVSLANLEPSVPERATLVVGPEGGWTPEELQVAAGLGTCITLGQRTLRADAMALVALSVMFARWGEF
jgi:16S rRNA (uracil1498-N3)-methyltransferase